MKEFALIKSRVNLNRVNLGIALISDLKVLYGGLFDLCYFHSFHRIQFSPWGLIRGKGVYCKEFNLSWGLIWEGLSNRVEGLIRGITVLWHLFLNRHFPPYLWKNVKVQVALMIRLKQIILNQSCNAHISKGLSCLDMLSVGINVLHTHWIRVWLPFLENTM